MAIEAPENPRIGILKALDDFERDNPNLPNALLWISIRYRSLLKQKVGMFIYGPVIGYKTRPESDTDTARELRRKLTAIDNGVSDKLRCQQGEIIESVCIRAYILGLTPKLYSYTRVGGTPVSEDITIT